MKAWIISFPRFESILKRRRTVFHVLLDGIYEIGDVIVAHNRDKDMKRGFGPFLRITALDVGKLEDFLARPGEAEALDTSMDEYRASWEAVHHRGTDIIVHRLECAYINTPTDEEATAVINALPPIPAIQFQEDLRWLKTVEAAIKAQS